MSWMKPSTLERARGHVARMTSRLAAVNMASSTLARLQAELSTTFDINPKTGWVVIASDHVVRLQSAAADLETVLREGAALHLGDRDLPQLRYLLAEEIVG